MNGLSDFAEKLKAMAANTERGVRRGLKQAAENAYQKAYAFCPVYTGALRASVSVKVENNGFHLTASAPYVEIVHRNTPFLQAAMEKEELIRTMMQSIREEIES
jgi:hypothetical protein